MNLIQTPNKGLGSYIVIQNDLIGRYIKHYGFWEKHMYDVYSKLITPDDVVIDAGANIGFHTVQFANLASEVHAFEPQKLIYNILCANILFNDVSEKVFQYDFGLSDKEITLYMEPLSNRDEKDGCHNFGGRGLDPNATKEQPVPLKTFDSLNIDFDVLKIDIQGSEIYALKGMLKSLRKNRPWIMLENYPNSENDQKVLELLFEEGYELCRFMHNNNEDCILYFPDKHGKIRSTLESLSYNIKFENEH
jgi:FkbM family methyltransferase